MTAPEEEAVLAGWKAIVGLGDVDAVDGLRVEDLEPAEEVGVVDVVDFEPCVFAGEEQHTVWAGLVEGESGYGAEAVAVLELGDGLGL